MQTLRVGRLAAYMLSRKTSRGVSKVLPQNGSIHAGTRSRAYSNSDPALERYRIRDGAEDMALALGICSEGRTFFTFLILTTWRWVGRRKQLHSSHLGSPSISSVGGINSSLPRYGCFSISFVGKRKKRKKNFALYIKTLQRTKNLIFRKREFNAPSLLPWASPRVGFCIYESA